MKKKLLVFTASVITLFLVFMVFNVYAHGDDSESGNNGVMINSQQLNQNQNSNQGSVNNIFKSDDSKSEQPEKVETPKREDNGQSDQEETGRERKEKRDNNQSDKKETNHEKSNINSSANENENENENEGMEKNSQKILMEKSNTVAKAVREMLTVVAKNKGIGEQVKVIAKKQVLNQEAIRESLGQVESRNKIVVFFIGPKYNEINKAKTLLKQNNKQINQLSQIGKEISNKDDAKKLDEQVAVLQNTNNQVQKIINNSENTFSLFGWLSKIFSRK